MTHMAAVESINDIIDYDVTHFQDGISFWLIQEKKWLNLDRKSELETNNVCCWEAIGGGRWLLSSDSIVYSSDMPSGGAAKGTRWVWTENNNVNQYDSMITYFYNGTAWKELSSTIRVHNGTPDSLSKTPNSDREEWIDTATGIIYHAHNGDWVIS